MGLTCLLVFLAITMGIHFQVVLGCDPHIGGHYKYQTDEFLARNSWWRVVNGRDAKQGEVPFIVSLQYRGDGDHFCGGSLVESPKTGKQFILTAAHCVDKARPGEFSVVAGAISLNESFNSQSATVERIVVHPAYNRNPHENDIALLVIPDFELNDNVKPIPLPGANDRYFGMISVFGWGLTNESIPEVSNHLQIADIPMVCLEQCDNWYYEALGERIIFNTQICAGLEHGGTDTCFGDSGGALTTIGPNDRTLLGITSWGIGCARPKLPGIYTKVSSYIPWILATMDQ